MRLLQSSLSPVESQARADMWLRLGVLVLTGVVAFVAYTLRQVAPNAALWLWLAVAGIVVIFVADYAARFLPNR